MKCRAKRCIQWRASTARCLTAGGLQRLWRPQILYLVGVSSHPFDVASYKIGVEHVTITAGVCPTPCFFPAANKNKASVWPFEGNAVNLHRKTKLQNRK
jgi:hypothetical protein